jgi:hypothetical protein
MALHVHFNEPGAATTTCLTVSCSLVEANERGHSSPVRPGLALSTAVSGAYEFTNFMSLLGYVVSPCLAHTFILGTLLLLPNRD